MYKRRYDECEEIHAPPLIQRVIQMTPPGPQQSLID